jgi:O-succinylbenzoate synthase
MASRRAILRSITIQDIKLHCIALPFVEKLRTSFGAEDFKSAILVEVITTDGISGWGEISVKTKPSYGAETMVTALHIAEKFLVPELVGQTLRSPMQVPECVKSVRGNHHARAGVEMAVWDAAAKANAMRLADCFAAHLPDGHKSRDAATVGVSIGIQPSLEKTIEIIQKRLDQGYKRIKLKIEPGWDVELARGVRDKLPHITLMLDANSAYTLDDAEHLAQLDRFDLLMIEQPLGYDDIYEHSELRKTVTTPICLDESISSAHDLRVALELGAIDILNLKPTRVGGFSESLRIYQLCVENELPLWIGGMLETGIGRAANVAFASLPGVTLPSDISATDRYFNPDITEPPFVLGPDSTLAVPDGVGIGVEVCRDRVEEAIARWEESRPY